MNNFWKKKLPAFFLTLVMLASLAPAALAVEDWKSDSDSHWLLNSSGQKVSVSGHSWSVWTTSNQPTCGTSGKKIRVCEICERGDTQEIPATGAHTYVTISERNGIVTKRCSVCKNEITEASNSAPSTQGKNFTISVGTTGGKFVGAQIRTNISDLFRGLTGSGDFSTVRFSATSGSGQVWHSDNLSYLWNSYSYSELYDRVWFVPSSSGSLSLPYTAENAAGGQISGTITLTGTPVSSDSTDIVLRVAPGGTADLRLARFEEAYRKLTGGVSGLRYIVFRTGNDYSSFDGMLYAGSSSLSRDNLDRYRFYTESRYDGDYALEDLSFRAFAQADVGDQLTMTVRYYDRNNDYREANLRIIIDKNGRQDDEVVYRVAPGNSVTFNRSDFNQVYRSLASANRDVRYVEFAPGDDYTTFAGDIRVSGHSAYSKKGLSDEWFYYTTDRQNSYGIDDLIFQAASGAKEGAELEIPFWACYDRDDAVKGVLRIIIDKNGSRDTVTLNVAPGGTARLEKADFNDVYRYLSDYNNRTISAVSFSAPDSYRNFYGALYVKNAILRAADLSHSGSMFYYSSGDAPSRNDYFLDDVTFQADRSAREGDCMNIPFRAYYGSSRDVYEEGILRIVVTSEVNTVSYEAPPGGSVSFTASDFNKAYQAMSNTNRTVKYVAFEAGSDYASFPGALYAGNTRLSRSDLTYAQTQFYNGTPNYNAYSIGSLYFRPDAGAADKSTLSMPFRAYYDASTYEQGTLKLTVSTGGDIACVVVPGKTVNLDRTKFDEFFRKSYSSSTLDYVVFDVPGNLEFPDSCGTLYTAYGTSYSTSFSRSGLQGVRFYYDAADARKGDYALNELTFAAANSFTSGKVTLRFTAYGDNGRSLEGVLVITPSTAGASSNLVGSVRYAVTSGTNVQINANDLARYYKTAYPAGTLQYVVLGDVPATGALYYNYYGASSYGSTTREQLTAANRSRSLYMSPATTAEYALTELTYVPSGSNYCASIPFTAYGTNGQSVTGGILISVTNKTVSEVYGPTPKNTAVTFPASSIAAAVAAATGTTPSGIQLLKLPAANVGAIYEGSGNTPASTTTVYGYNTGVQQLGQLRFVPQTGYTGPVEIPYVALNASNVPIASGMFSMGVLNTNKKFGDINAATWCYKYVTELADATVIDGYADGNFKPDSTITYGAALKLIMLAAGYPEQAPTTAGSTFSGYLAKAQADGLVTRSNVALNGPITRLQVAQLAAGALRLDINNLSSVKPFTDTSDVYVQALNAAGIVEGYFNNGTSTFRPSNTLTRGQVSPIVWRMQNYRK